MTRKTWWLVAFVGANVALWSVVLLFGLPLPWQEKTSAQAALPVAPPSTTTGHLYTYKKTPQGDLQLELFLPPGWRASDQRPAAAFFFGGGWYSTRLREFQPHAEYFASRGMVTATVNYRVFTMHGTKPDKCVEDAKSAIRWLRQNAGRLGIDPNRIVASGGSAGGQLAAATALCPGFDTPGEDPKISNRPNALVLYYAVLDMTDNAHVPLMDGDTLDARRDLARRMSPLRYLSKDCPPTLILFGSTDYLVPIAQEFYHRAHAAGAPVELFLAPDQWHGFIYYPQWHQSALHVADRFLAKLGYLKGEPTAKVEPGAEFQPAKPDQRIDPSTVIYMPGYGPGDYQVEK